MKNRTTPAVSRAATTTDGEKFSGRDGSSSGRGGTMTGSGRGLLAALARRHCRRTSSGSRPR